jgi:hypothetical protein
MSWSKGKSNKYEKVYKNDELLRSEKRAKFIGSSGKRYMVILPIIILILLLLPIALP